jgi:osmotically-inducible protein OsmY
MLASFTEGVGKMNFSTQLQQKVLDELSWEASINASDIRVNVQGDLVVLSGTVSSLADKANAERAALRVAGVGALVVELNVSLPELNQKSDVELARRIESVLHWSNHAALHKLTVKVEKGWVTLYGSVAWQFLRQVAYDSVRYLMGVRGVSNEITLQPAPGETDILHDIRAAFLRQSQIHTAGVTLDVQRDKVLIGGSVPSLPEHRLVVQTVWNTPGVSSIEDLLKVKSQQHVQL